MESWTNVCRSCLSPHMQVSFLNDEHNIKEKFLEVTTIKVKEDDGLPQSLCEQCYELMNSAYQFKMKCIKMDVDLKLQLDALLNQNLSQYSQIETTVESNEENEEGDKNYSQYEPMEVEVNTMSQVKLLIDQQASSLNQQLTTTNQENEFPLEDMNSKNFIQRLKPSGDEQTIYLNGDEGIKYLTEAELSKDDDGEQREVILGEGSSESSQLQIVKCDQSGIVTDYATGNETPPILPQDYDSSFLCDCGEKFKDLAEYEKHQHNPTGEHLCNLCGKWFTTIETLTGHMLLHRVASASLNCPFCNQLIKRNNLTQHIKYTHNNKPMCNLCDKTFVNHRTLKKHMVIHSELQINQKTSDQEITMQSHRKTHVKTPCLCNYCGLYFVSRAAVQQHKEKMQCSQAKIIKSKEDLIKTVKHVVITSHGKFLGYACSLCKKMFSVESALEQHIESIHIGEAIGDPDKNKKPLGRFEFKCRICRKGFAKQTALVMHERMHTDDRRFPCQICSLRYKTKVQLQTHLLTHRERKSLAV